MLKRENEDRIGRGWKQTSLIICGYGYCLGQFTAKHVLAQQELYQANQGMASNRRPATSYIDPGRSHLSNKHTSLLFPKRTTEPINISTRPVPSRAGRGMIWKRAVWWCSWSWWILYCIWTDQQPDNRIQTFSSFPSCASTLLMKPTVELAINQCLCPLTRNDELIFLNFRT